MPTEKTSLQAIDVSDVFSRSVTSLKSTIPPGTTGSIDLKVSFSSVRVSEKGWKFIYTNKKEEKSAISIDLATRIYTDSLKRPTPANAEAWLRNDLVLRGHLMGEEELSPFEDIEDSLLATLLDLFGQEPDTLVLDSPRRLAIGYLQARLNAEGARPLLAIDGIYGAKSEAALLHHWISIGELG